MYELNEKVILFFSMEEEEQKLGFCGNIVALPKDGSIIIQTSFLGEIFTHQIPETEITQRVHKFTINAQPEE